MRLTEKHCSIWVRTFRKKNQQIPMTKRMTGMYGEEKESKVIIFPVVQKENTKVIKDGGCSIILFFSH